MERGVKVSLCAICAWRETCKLKFRFKGGPVLNCVEFTKDVTIELEKGPHDGGKGEKGTG